MMPPRTSARKQAKPNKIFGRGLKVDKYPSEREWNCMKTYESFIVLDDADDHPFYAGAKVLILPAGADPEKRRKMHRYWVGHIREIRGDGPANVWSKVQWYWAGEDIDREYARLDTAAIGNSERLLSDDIDLVHCSSFEAEIRMHSFREGDLNQAPIPDGDRDFYTRYTLDHEARVVRPKPAHDCICEAPYNPDNDTMRLCPNTTCEAWFHVRCLVDRPTQRRRSSTSRSALFDPSSIRPSNGPPSPPKRVLRSSDTAAPTSPSSARRGKQVAPPQDLLALAQSPIVRGGACGVVGNARAVLGARALVRVLLNGTKRRAPVHWREDIGADHLPVRPVAGEKEEVYKCPRCGGPV